MTRRLRSGRRPADGPKGWRQTGWFLVALFGVGFVLRFLVARAFAGEPVWDGHYYDFGAHRIAEGHGYSDDRIVDGRVEWHPWCHYPVGYSGYLAAFYWVFGGAPWVAHFADAIAGSLLAVVVFLLASEGLSPSRARFAGILTAIHPGLVLYGALVMGEVLAALGVLLAFWVAIRGSRTLGAVRGIALGALVLGVSALVRPQALLCAPFLAFAAPVAANGRWIEWAKRAAVACAVTLVPVLPWTARNCAVMDGCALVSTNAGWNLAIGAFPRATGRFETLRSSDGCRDVTGQVQQDRCWLAYGIDQIERSPGRWLGLVPAKLAYTFDHESFAVEYLREARPDEWPEDRRVAWRAAITTLHRLLVVASPLAFIAFALPRKRRARDARRTRAQGAALLVAIAAGALGIAADRPTLWPIVLGTCVLAVLPLPGRPPPLPALLLPVALVATTALTHAIFFGDDRYHMVITPVLCLFAAAVLREPGEQNTRGADTEGARAAGASSS